MPSFLCSHPTCTTTLDDKGYCPRHAHQFVAYKSHRSNHYDKYSRDPESKKFYNSTAWKNCRREKLTKNPTCEVCKKVFAEHVHHIIPLAECTEDQKTDQSNLMSVCAACHNKIESETKPEEPPQIIGQLQPTEDPEYFYDAHRGTAIERFAAKYCNHWRGSLRGKPFILHPLQTAILRSVYGFIHRETKLRRFQSLWIESGIGSGKTPVMAICGLEHLLGGDEPGAHIYSIANSYGQADHMFSAAKMFIKNNEHLRRLVERGRLEVTKYEIYYPPNDSRWQITSGSGAKAGGAASLLLVDEVHQIEKRSVYDDLQGRQSKRDQPLIICATNAAKHPHPLYADLHEEAEHTLTNGPRFNRRLFPVIWAAPKDADPSSPESWRKANPLIGVTIDENKIADEWKRAQGSPALEARFRLQYLGQPVDDIQKWLNIPAFEKCCQPFERDEVKDLPLYVGVDASKRDDFLAVNFIWAGAEKFYTDTKFWLPRKTANHYQVKNDISYDEWSEKGDITLLDSETLSVDQQQKIANQLIEINKVTPIKSVCYDRTYSSFIIATLEAADITCIRVGQGWEVAQGCQELAARLKEQSIQFMPNDVMRFCAENVEVKDDQRGNFWPVKPGATAKSTGKRHLKIDGISALVTALTIARKHYFPQAAQNNASAFMVEL